MSAYSKLSSQHQLVIAHYRANGRVQHEAWRAAGFADTKSARSTAARWFNTDEAKAALAELDGHALNALKADGDEVLARLATILRGNMLDFVKVGEDGHATQDLARASREQWGAVQQIKIGKDGEVTLKLYDARAAAVDLGKHLGLFRQRLDDLLPGDDDDTADTPDRDLARRVLLAFALNVAKGASPGAKTPKATRH